MRQLIPNGSQLRTNGPARAKQRDPAACICAYHYPIHCTTPTTYTKPNNNPCCLALYARQQVVLLLPAFQKETQFRIDNNNHCVLVLARSYIRVEFVTVFRNHCVPCRSLLTCSHQQAPRRAAARH